MNTQTVQELTFSQLAAISEITRIGQFVVAEIEPSISEKNLVFWRSDIMSALNALGNKDTVFNSDAQDTLFRRIWEYVPTLEKYGTYKVDSHNIYTRIREWRDSVLSGMLTTTSRIQVIASTQGVNFIWGYMNQDVLSLSWAELDLIPVTLNATGLKSWLYITRYLCHNCMYTTRNRPDQLDMGNFPDFVAALEYARYYRVYEAGGYELLELELAEGTHEWALPAPYGSWYHLMSSLLGLLNADMSVRLLSILEGKQF